MYNLFCLAYKLPYCSYEYHYEHQKMNMNSIKNYVVLFKCIIYIEDTHAYQKLLPVGTERERVQSLCVLDFVGVVVTLVPVREGYLT